MSRLVALFVLACVSCAHTVSPAAALVRETTIEAGDVTNCIRLPNATGEAAGRGDGAIARAKAEARDAAALNLATHIIWVAPGEFLWGTSVLGYTYRCPVRSPLPP